MKCENCGVDIPKGKYGVIEIWDRNPKSSVNPKQVLQVHICRDCIDKAEFVISDWLDKGMA